MVGAKSIGNLSQSVTLVAFDFDGTLTAAEMNVRLGELVGASAEMGAITARAMDGELPFAESLRARVALLEGAPVAAVERTLSDVGLRPGSADLLEALADANVPTVILTGGYERGVRAALEAEGVTVDRVVANRLVAVDGVLTGTVAGPLVTGSKRERLRALADEFGVPMSETVAVGDGANDRQLLAAAGVGIGYAPKPAVADVVDETVDSMPALAAVLRRRDALPSRVDRSE